MTNRFHTKNLTKSASNYPVQKGGAGSGRYPAGSGVSGREANRLNALKRMSDLANKLEDLGHHDYNDLKPEIYAQAAKLHAELARLHRAYAKRADITERESGNHIDAAEQHGASSRAFAGIARRAASGTINDYELQFKQDDAKNAIGVSGWLTSEARGGQRTYGR